MVISLCGADIDYFGLNIHVRKGNSGTRWVKINVDAAYYPGSGHMGVGCVMRDDIGKFLRARTNTIRGGKSAREAEAISMREALSWVKNWRVTKWVIRLLSWYGFVELEKRNRLVVVSSTDDTGIELVGARKNSSSDEFSSSFSGQLWGY
ncbi:hypothetical protein AgCh_001132 [Apium graveolens]